MLRLLLNRWLKKSSGADDSAPDRFALLQQMQRRHSFIEVKFPRIERSFQSMILELRPSDGLFLADELYPPEGREKLLEGDIAEISCRERGLTVNFFSRLLLREVSDGVPMYHMELPDDIGASYRRHAFRVYVEREPDLGLDMRDAEGNPCNASVVNLSADGIKVSFAGDYAKQIEREQHFKNVLIRLPDGGDIDCEIQFHNSYVMRSPGLHTLAGGSLKITTAPQRTRLDQYLASVQRRQRRRESRMG
ncbi:MAG: flagellar regulator YcgR PilZN domain-containing protein [Spongiibacteraceae bacterium]